MAKLKLSDEIIEKLERAVHLRWVDPRDDQVKTDQVADERTALTGELSQLFGPVIKQLIRAEIFSVHFREQEGSGRVLAEINNVTIDDEIGIKLDCEQG